MTGLRRLEHASELLDSPRHDPIELAHSLAQVADVNRFLGGTRALLRTLRPWLGPGAADLSVLDVGTGSADLPRVIAQRAARAGLAVRITAVDAHPQVVEIARHRCLEEPAIRLVLAHALELPFADDSHDLVLLSLVLHHLEQDDQRAALREAARVARRTVVVGELHRSRPALAGARLLAATAWRRNRLTRHDGPLSVLRAFTAAELTVLGTEAGLRSVRVTRHPFFRLVLTGRP